ncbi:hypothetical protein AGMMS50230_03220 [Spirochaetia bacterium]|nr:hypothetical protein AGMMS50230_03220 [Spirochaetia bacterium]
MARTLTFTVNGADYSASPVKIDRSKLYGWTELKALDENGRECRMVNMDETGTLIIPKGGLGLGILSPDRSWVDRTALKAVTLDGGDAELIKSSYSGPIELKNTVDTDTFLDHSISTVYQLEEAPAELTAAVGDNIYTFTYSYRDSYKGDTAFILTSDNTLFMLVGFKTEYEMLGLAQAGTINETEETDEDAEEESDELDFSMGL